jgi:nicotinamidase-related amidase
VPELDMSAIDAVIEKGQIADVEMYSAFYTPLKEPRVGDSGLAARLRDAGISHVYVVGLAADYCVKATALHANEEGFGVCIVEEGTRPVDGDAWEEVREGIRRAGVKVVDRDSEEVRRVEGR